MLSGVDGIDGIDGEDGAEGIGAGALTDGCSAEDDPADAAPIPAGLSPPQALSARAATASGAVSLNRVLRFMVFPQGSVASGGVTSPLEAIRYR
ncbi:hypothetical protein DWQ67_06645 [Galactobacter caseinivorans]|uniref:Uncharacterized protein n=1 Tax=Galactobacter caseinivorans TaxID=2676123 RepID=A0A496PJW1_9MICC|nr:hypothetical protein DWQ67_06645 [Galactobacter caseinivorans]